MQSYAKDNPFTLNESERHHHLVRRLYDNTIPYKTINAASPRGYVFDCKTSFTGRVKADHKSKLTTFCHISKDIFYRKHIKFVGRLIFAIR